MEGKTRNLYPGGNTPCGFYSYYNYILPQRKAEKIFCIKGGPGTGKSTLMKKIGRHFVDKGEEWTSSGVPPTPTLWTEYSSRDGGRQS